MEIDDQERDCEDDTLLLQKRDRRIVPSSCQGCAALVLFLLLGTILGSFLCASSSHFFSDIVLRHESQHVDPALPSILIVMSDNRNLTSDQQQYHNLAIAINYLYSRLHDYGFVFVHLGSHSQLTDKNSPACFNSLLKQDRAAPWCKLLSLIAAMRLSHSKSYDLLFFIDSDAIFYNYHQSVVSLLESVPIEGHECSATKFLDLSSSCKMLFFDNSPWQIDRPNTGQFILHNQEATSLTIKQWWNINQPDKNFAHAYEQDALWVKFVEIQQNISFGIIHQPSMILGEPLQLARHVPGIDADQRLPVFSDAWSRMSKHSRFAHSNWSFLEVIDRIRFENVLELNTSTDKWIE